MTSFAVLLVALSFPAGDKGNPPAKKPPPARVVVTGEVACLHCHFGVGEDCAPCLKMDEDTPLLLAGKVAKEYEAITFDKKVVVIEGTLSVNKDKRLVLTSDKGKLLTAKDKDKAPAGGQACVVGTPTCGKCDLGLCEECTLAVVNAGSPIILDGKLAVGHAEDVKGITVVGRLFVDKRGLLRLSATKVDLAK
jgi:hypothetical protein